MCFEGEIIKRKFFKIDFVFYWDDECGKVGLSVTYLTRTRENICFFRTNFKVFSSNLSQLKFIDEKIAPIPADLFREQSGLAIFDGKLLVIKRSSS
jgi:hypothetical protein